MPKINIYNANTLPGSGRYRLELGWARNQDVTLAVTRLADGADPLEEYFAPDPAPAADTTDSTIYVAGDDVRTGTATSAATKFTFRDTTLPAATITGPAGTQELVPTWQGWRMVLDRTHINQLIIELRRARDVAYGRDA